MSNSRLAYLFQAYFDKTATPAEREELMQLLEQTENNEQIRNLLTSTWQQHSSARKPFSDVEGEQMLAAILEQGRMHKPVISMKTRPVNRWKRILAAAAIILLIGSGGYFWFSYHPQVSFTDNMLPVRDSIVPGTDKAVLTLANGSRIVLDSTQKGMLASQGDVQVMNIQAAELSYNAGNANIAVTMFNTLSTPRGGQYKLQLADGTKVWLNASSSITFPVAFNDEERRVAITGEAYFEVAKVSSLIPGKPRERPVPFIVNIDKNNRKSEVVVLGTHFNVNAYADEENIFTTLLEGRVLVRSDDGSGITPGQKVMASFQVPGGVMLSPGYQAKIKASGEIKTGMADIEEVMAWKNGWFQFNGSDIATIMRQVSRWYDVDIAYQGKIPSGHYTGAVSRTNNIEQVLKIMQGGDVGFAIEGKKVTVFEDHHQP